MSFLKLAFQYLVHQANAVERCLVLFFLSLHYYYYFEPDSYHYYCLSLSGNAYGPTNYKPNQAKQTKQTNQKKSCLSIYWSTLLLGFLLLGLLYLLASHYLIYLAFCLSVSIRATLNWVQSTLRKIIRLVPLSAIVCCCLPDILYIL